MDDGSELVVPYADPVAFLDHVLGTSHQIRELYARKLSEYGAEWQICLYADEVTPGNPLKPRNKRKVWAIYWSCLQLSSHLCNELFWNVLMVIRSDQVYRPKKVRSPDVAPVILEGMCQVFRACLAILTNDISSLKFGKFFRSLGSVIMASPALFIGDEPAIKHCVGNKGSAGNKPCILCSNCVSVRSELWQHSANLFPHSCYDFAKFLASTDESIWEKVELLTARKPVLSKSDFAELQQGLGLNYTPHGVLWDPARTFRPCSMIQFDWMHVLLVQGLFQLEVNLCLSKLAHRGFTYQKLHSYLQLGLHF